MTPEVLLPLIGLRQPEASLGEPPELTIRVVTEENVWASR